tara:strand:+ start:27 stop:563 length:537 start_codon:yes stop_codon:yes gene_type:complete
MAGTQYYATVANKIDALETPNLSKNNLNALKSAFPQSPLYIQENIGGINEDERKDKFKKLVMNGEVLNGNGFTVFNRDYSQGPTERERAPDVPNITQDNSGRALYSPYVPNPTSPGAGSLSANDKPMHDVPPPSLIEIADKQFGVGFNSVFNPLESSQYIEELDIVRPDGASSLINEV